MLSDQPDARLGIGVIIYKEEITMSHAMEQFKVIEVAAITPLMAPMHRILSKTETLTHVDIRTLQELLALLAMRLRDDSFDVDADGGV